MQVRKGLGFKGLRHRVYLDRGHEVVQLSAFA